MFYNDVTKRSFGKSVRVFEVEKWVIDNLFEYGTVECDLPTYPNQPLVLKNGENQSALAIAKGDHLASTNNHLSYFKISGRNKEQTLLSNLLSDPEIRCIVVTGEAGTGKTTMVGSYVLDQVIDKQNFEKMILSKPLEIVTSSRYWGTVPGDEDDKFGPFLKSYQIMFEGMVGKKGSSYVGTLINKGVIDFMPLELMRGASLKESIVWYDEAQNLNNHEMQTLGSRIDDVGQSKLVLTGDLDQRDRRIKKEKTGMMKLITSKTFLESRHTAHIDLIQNERGVISQLFADVFEEQ